jgi:hypothetical protein
MDRPASALVSASRATIPGMQQRVVERAETMPEPERCLAVDASKRLPCDVCGTPMEPEHAHYRCPVCHYILPCCGW